MPVSFVEHDLMNKVYFIVAAMEKSKAGSR